MKRSKTKLYKVLLPEGKPAHGGSGVWDLPKGRKPGAWMPAVDDPGCCERGYHLVTAVQLIQWLDRAGLEVWEAEGSGKHHDQSDKSAWQKARLLRKVGTWTDVKACLFAADCAEAVLHIFEREQPNDDRPRKAIEAVRAFALGKIDRDARDAASCAAWATCIASARDAKAAARAAKAARAAAAAGWATCTVSCAIEAAWDARAAAAMAAAGRSAATWAVVRDTPTTAHLASLHSSLNAAARAQSQRLLYWLKRPEGK